MVIGSVNQMHGHYRSPTGHIKLAHHAVCAVRCMFDDLCCHATLAIMLLTLVSAIVHSVEIIYFLKFLTL